MNFHDLCLRDRIGPFGYRTSGLNEPITELAPILPQGRLFGQFQSFQAGTAAHVEQHGCRPPLGMFKLEPQGHILNQWVEVTQGPCNWRAKGLGEQPRPSFSAIGTPPLASGIVADAHRFSHGRQALAPQAALHNLNAFRMCSASSAHRPVLPYCIFREDITDRALSVKLGVRGMT